MTGNHFNQIALGHGTTTLFAALDVLKAESSSGFANRCISFGQLPGGIAVSRRSLLPQANVCCR